MPKFTCSVCETSFEVPQHVLDRYEGWEPRYCREHSPSKRRATKSPTRRPRARREENLTPSEVLEKYDDGPKEGVFTDGSAIPNPGPGGWGVVWVEQGRIVREAHGAEDDTTNNRMELQALIEAYRMLPEDAEIAVHTDSRLCVDTITKWAPGWERKGWTKKGGPIKNLERVQELLALYRAHPRCPLRWIAAHSGFRWNEYADSLATTWLRERD